MRILHVIRTLNPAWGGPVEGLKSLITQARSNNIEVEVACVDEPDSPWVANWTQTVHAVGGVTRVLGRGISTYGHSRNLDRWLTENIDRFDALVVQGIWMYFSYAVWKAARKANVPYFLFIHGALDPWFKEYYPSKNPKKILYWKLFEHKVLRDAAAVVFTTEEEKLRAHNAFLPYQCTPFVGGYGIPRPPIGAIEDKVELRRQFTESYPSLKNRPFLLYLGRIHEKKGVDLLLKAYKRTGPGMEPTALVVAGPGDAGAVTKFKQMTRDLGLEESVIWTGPLYKNQKWTAMKAADAFILPSHQENFGISVVESLACGVPVLISEKVNIWREVQRAGAGISEPDDLEGTIRLMERWAALSEFDRIKMSDSARQCFAQYFDVVNNAPLFFDLIRQTKFRTLGERSLAAAV